MLELRTDGTSNSADSLADAEVKNENDFRQSL